MTKAQEGTVVVVDGSEKRRHPRNAPGGGVGEETVTVSRGSGHE